MSTTSVTPANTNGSRPFNVGVTFQHDLYDLGDAVMKSRAIQAFDNAAARFPIHRLLRYAARRPLELVFDDLALNFGLTAQRLDTGTLLLDGPGVFVQAEGWRHAGYCSCSFNVWAESVQRALPDGNRAATLAAVYKAYHTEKLL